MLELTFLGSGNAFTPGGRYWSSFLANGRFLFDAPPTVVAHMKRLSCSLGDLRVAFITHFHGDHFMGLPFLFLEYIYLTERRDPLYIVGPPGVGQTVEEFADRCYPDLSRREAGYRRLYIEAAPGQDQMVDEIPFRALAMTHTGGKLECLGYRVTLGEKTVAYTGDTEYCQEIFALAQGADVLVLDCSYSQGSGAEHIGFDEVREIRRRIDPAITLILTHLEADPDTSGLDNVIVAQDFATYHFR